MAKVSYKRLVEIAEKIAPRLREIVAETQALDEDDIIEAMDAHPAKLPKVRHPESLALIANIYADQF